MLKSRYRIIDKLKDLLIFTLGNAVLVNVLAVLLKLLYFNSQIGTGNTGSYYLLASLGSLLMLASIGLLFRRRADIYMCLLNVALTFVMFCNIVFYRYFNDLISIPLLFQARNLSDVQSSMLELVHWNDLLLIIDFILLPILAKHLRKRAQLTTGIGGMLKRTAICCTIGTGIVLFGFSQLVKSQPTILKTFYDRVYVAQNIGLLNYHAADVYTFVQQSIDDSKPIDENKKAAILAYFEKSKEPKDDEKQLFGLGKGKNIIVIQSEALQQFVLGKSVNGQEITPNLNKLAGSSIYFDNYYYQTAGGGTSDAEFTSMVSMFPMKEGAVYIRKPGNYYYSLPNKLKEYGYSTVAMHGYKPGFWNRTMVYKNIGFDEFYSMSNMDTSELLGMGISDKSFFSQAAEKLKAQKTPYFAFLISLSNHFPYDNDKSYYSSFDVGEFKDTLMGDYLESVHYADEALGQYIEELRGSGVLEDAVLVLYGDHHGIPKANEQELEAFIGKDSFTPLEWQQLQKVPMIIHAEGLEPMEIHRVGGGVDFMPTLLNIMGIDAANQPSFGRDLVNVQSGMAVLRNGSFITDEMLYISSENTCYDIKSGAVLSLEQYAKQKQQADMFLDYSDTILKYDLSEEIRNYLENN